MSGVSEWLRDKAASHYGDNSPSGRYWKKRYADEVRADRMRAARALGSHTAEEWEEILEQCEGRCMKCGYRADGWRPCKDHIVPIALGGSDAASNLQPLCRQCNTGKRGDTTNWRHYREQHGWADATHYEP